MSKKRIVITGIGIVSPIGIGKDEFWKNLFAGKSGIKTITLFDTSKLKVKVGGEITDFNAKEILGKKGLIDLDRATKLLLAAGKFALEDSGCDIDEANTNSTGISVGTTFGSLSSLSNFDRASLAEGPHFVNPSRFPNTVINSPASRMAIRYKIKGFCSTISTGECSALNALEYAMNAIEFGRAQRVLVGCVQEMCIQIFLGLYKVNYLSGMNYRAAVSSPFDKERDGIVFSEGAGVFLIEDIEAALKRKAKIYSEILSISSNFDPYRLYKYNPKGEGMKESMDSAISEAKFLAADVDCIFANANSTLDADLIEAKVINEIFNKSVPVTAIKSIIGETMSASGGMSIAAGIGSLIKQKIPPVINHKTKDPDCDLNYVLEKNSGKSVNKILINSFAPHGANSSLVLGKVS